MKDMKLYKFDVVKNDRKYKNFLLVWTYGERRYKMYVKPSFFKDVKIALAVSEQVEDYSQCE